MGMLTTLLWKKMSAQGRMQELEERYGIPMRREVVEEVTSMCSYSAAIKEQAKAEGKAEGKTEGRAEAVCILLESMGEVPETVKERILRECDEDLLGSWLKLTRKVGSWQEFCAMAHITE